MPSANDRSFYSRPAFLLLALVLPAVVTLLCAASFGLGMIRGQLNLYQARFEQDRRIVRDELGDLFTESGLAMERTSTGEIYISGPPVSEAVDRQLRDELTRLFGERRAEFMMGGVLISEPKPFVGPTR